MIVIKVKIFVKDNCPNCPRAKDLGKILETEGQSVEYHDITTIEGLAESSYHGIMSTPSIVIVKNDGAEKTSWRSNVPDISDVRQVLVK